MKKLFFIFALMCAFAFESKAQKYALIDMEYIFSNIPEYIESNKKLDAEAEKRQKEIEVVLAEAKKMYEAYQSATSMTPAVKKQKEDAIYAKEKEAQDLRKKYFGQEGELVKKRESIIKPWQDAIYEVVKTVSAKNGYKMVVDRSSSANIIFASPDIDISDEILSQLGYSK